MRTSTDKCSMIHIGILEDDPLRLVGFQSILDRVPDFQATGMTVAEVVASQDVHIALLGNRSRMRFLETMARLKELRPDLRVVVTVTGMDDETILKAHVAKLMRKVGVKNRIALSVHAINHSLVQHVN